MPATTTTTTATGTANPLPKHWYIFFGIIEPISVLSGACYATFFSEKYYHELIPTAFLSSSRVELDVTPIQDATKMALGQLGSCYFLLMLNSLFLFHALKTHLAKSNPVAMERILYYLIAALGIADWTHILITLYALPTHPSGQPFVSAWIQKVWLLCQPSSWNALVRFSPLFTRPPNSNTCFYFIFPLLHSCLETFISLCFSFSFVYFGGSV